MVYSLLLIPVVIILVAYKLDRHNQQKVIQNIKSRKRVIKIK